MPSPSRKGERETREREFENDRLPPGGTRIGQAGGEREIDRERERARERRVRDKRLQALGYRRGEILNELTPANFWSQFSTNFMTRGLSKS